MRTDDTVTAAFVADARKTLADAQDKIVHCISQLDDDQLNWRPFEQQNSIANIILHLCGNVGQWIIAGVEQLPDTRHRPSEFSDRKQYSKTDVLARLALTVREAEATISRVTSETLLQPRRIQGFDISVLSAIFDAVSHFRGHSQEIVYITRLQLKEKYKFKFVPATKEQGA
jgi:uncharacterized damage-inducible protein DinB